MRPHDLPISINFFAVYASVTLISCTFRVTDAKAAKNLLQIAYFFS
jgi:hypothetical protein